MVRPGIRKIDTIFTKDERNLHHIVFTYGDGAKGVIGDFSREEDPGRRETFKLEDGEQLLGCELDHSKQMTFGVTWIVWLPP